MANRLKMVKVNAIQQLVELGWSYRRIARELGVHRETVARYAKGAQGSESKPAISTAGAGEAEDSKPAISTPGSPGRPSLSAGFQDKIVEKLELGLTAKRIHQDLVSEHAFAGSYESVKRFVRRLQQARALPFRRMECTPGEEGQVDFGTGAPVEQHAGRRRRPHLFRIVLSFSRKGYSEAVWRQTTDEFIRCLENAFWHFGGAPRTLIIDNLKAAVSKADWYDPEIHPRIEAFARHYGVTILPTKPYTPRHKGKIESGIKFAQDNALKGRTFRDLDQQNAFLKQWEIRVADHRIHGTTRKQVASLFGEHERQALLPLPATRFPFFHEAQRIVHRDGHVALDRAFYSVPPEYLARKVWVRWDSHIVRIFDDSFQLIATHARARPGKFSTQQAHLAAEKISAVEKGAEYLLSRARLIGPKTSRWALAMLSDRGVAGLRVLQGLLRLASVHASTEIEQVCEVAGSHGAYQLKSIRRLLKQRTEQTQLAYLEIHPLIRDLAEYGDLVRSAIQASPSTPTSTPRETQ